MINISTPHNNRRACCCHFRFVIHHFIFRNARKSRCATAENTIVCLPETLLQSVSTIINR